METRITIHLSNGETATVFAPCERQYAFNRMTGAMHSDFIPVPAKSNHIETGNNNDLLIRTASVIAIEFHDCASRSDYIAGL